VGRSVSKKYFASPDLLLGFDTETTGLDVASERAISYGFAAYERGRPVWSEHIFVKPDRPISPGAQRVHGVSMEELEAKYLAHEAVSVPMGLIRAVAILRDYLSRGASIVGANVSFFDIEMLRRSYSSVLHKDLRVDLQIDRIPVIDVIQHDEAIEPRSVNPRRRSLTHLCQYYGVDPGGHNALSDARAAVEVFLAQIVRNDEQRRAAAAQISLPLSFDRSDVPLRGY